jgi:hypothetical protein
VHRLYAPAGGDPLLRQIGDANRRFWSRPDRPARDPGKPGFLPSQVADRTSALAHNTLQPGTAAAKLAEINARNRAFYARRAGETGKRER